MLDSNLDEGKGRIPLRHCWSFQNRRHHQQFARQVAGEKLRAVLLDISVVAAKYSGGRW